MNLLNSKKEFRLSSDLFIGFILTFLLSFTSCLEKLESKVIEGPFFKGSNNFYYIEDNDTLVFNKKDSMLIGIKTANASIGLKVEDGDENGILYHEYRLEQTYKIFIDSNLFVYSLRARFPFDRDGYIYYDLKNDSISGLLLFDLVSDDFNKSKILLNQFFVYKNEVFDSLDGSYYYYDKQDSVIVFKNPNDKKYAQGDKLYANYYFTYRFHTYPIWEIPLEFIHNHPYVKTDIPSSPDYKVENSNFVLFNFPISKDYTLMRYTFSDEYGDTNLLDYELISINPYYGDMERIDSIRLALKNVRQDFIDRQIVESILLKLDSYTIIEKDKGMFDYKLKYSLVKP